VRKIKGKQILFPLKDKKVIEYIEYLRKKYKPLNRDETIED